MTFDEQLAAGMQHLSAHDPVLALLIEQYGPATLQPHTNYYEALVRSVISQQLSVRAAATITSRFIDNFSHMPTPEELLATDDDSLRSCGLSYQKIRYVRDIALHSQQGTLRFDNLADMGNDEIIARLTSVRGIGVWTAHMFLIFCAGRLNVLPTGDLGIQNAVAMCYGVEKPAPENTIKEIAVNNSWQPYESIASWYLWRSLDNKPV